MKILALFALSASTLLLADGHPLSGSSFAFVIPMPEPSALPEAILCVAGVGFLAWRQRGLFKNRK